MKHKSRMTLARRSAWTGRLFALPFYLGFLFFFFTPLTQSLSFVFNTVKVDVGEYVTTPVGLDNLTYIFKLDKDFGTNLLESMGQLAWQLPVIIIASLFFALLLNQKFIGRTFARAVFFLPVIVASGVVITIIKGDAVASSMMSGNVVNDGGAIFQSSALQDLLVRAGLNSSLINLFTTISNSLFDILWKTGMQMIIFLAGLQSISPSLYEASAMEGATAWDNFWMISLPMLAPMLLVNIVYTVVDSFTSNSNPVMNQVMQQISNVRLHYAAAMAWVYFLLIAVVLAVILGIFHVITNRRKAR